MSDYPKVLYKSLDFEKPKYMEVGDEKAEKEAEKLGFYSVAALQAKKVVAEKTVQPVESVDARKPGRPKGS